MEKDRIATMNDTFKKLIERSRTILNKTKQSMPSGLKQRLISALVLIPIVILAIYISPILFSALILMIAVLMSFEWFELVSKKPKELPKWKTFGLFYILIPCFSLLWLRSITNGADIILWLFVVVWMTDTAAFAVGKSLGGPKLAPTISPSKTWSGLGGGVFASLIIGLISSIMFVPGNALFFVLASGLLAAIEQLSDLLESKIKRYFGVKDSGSLIPGHGGILDRVDGIILTAPAVVLLVMFNSERFF